LATPFPGREREKEKRNTTAPRNPSLDLNQTG
jgi:hypothetical protein